MVLTFHIYEGANGFTDKSVAAYINTLYDVTTPRDCTSVGSGHVTFKAELEMAVASGVGISSGTVIITHTYVVHGYHYWVMVIKTIPLLSLDIFFDS